MLLKKDLSFFYFNRFVFRTNFLLCRFGMRGVIHFESKLTSYIFRDGFCFVQFNAFLYNFYKLYNMLGKFFMANKFPNKKLRTYLFVVEKEPDYVPLVLKFCDEIPILFALVKYPPKVFYRLKLRPVALFVSELKIHKEFVFVAKSKNIPILALVTPLENSFLVDYPLFVGGLSAKVLAFWFFFVVGLVSYLPAANQGCSGVKM